MVWHNIIKQLESISESNLNIIFLIIVYQSINQKRGRETLDNILWLINELFILDIIEFVI